MRVDGILGEQFDSLDQQEKTATAGMWVFLATEIIFFGGLFTAYTVYRATYPSAFAQASGYANILLGTINTAVLLTSSFFMALAVGAAKLGNSKAVIRFLGLTILLAVAFLVFKGVEYREHILDGLFPGRTFKDDLPPQVELFFWLYFVMTGLHAVHVFIGICVLAAIMMLARRGRFSSDYANPLEVAGLYWHFVDIVWVFLYPLFYLIHK